MSPDPDGHDEGAREMLVSRYPSRVGRYVVVVLGVLLAALPVLPARAQAAPYVKYYTVESAYAGKPEGLRDIAERFLGTRDRAEEIFNLNVGRAQPGGGALTDPSQLRAGWHLVLPWDAVGDGVERGSLPSPSSPSARPPSGGASAAPPATNPLPRPTIPSPSPTPSPSGTNKPGSGGAKCGTATRGDKDRADWAERRMSPERAWSRSRGEGQMIAIVDSGVDGSLAELRGRVTQGMDVVAGSGRGDVDCLGTGTAMAGIAIAQSGSKGKVTGVAPEATVMPVRVVTTKAESQPADQAAGIEVAVAAGATVIALGSYVDPNVPAVAEAIATAVKHDIVVVSAADLESSDPESGLPDRGMLRVGGIDGDGKMAASYRAGGVDVVAPAVDVASLGIGGAGEFVGSGTQYAVAYAAGQAALVRSAYPNLSAAQVTERIRSTASRTAETSEDPASYGDGVIDPFTSVNAAMESDGGAAAPNGPPAGDSDSSTSGGQVAIFVLIGLVLVAVTVLSVMRLRTVLRSDDRKDPEPELDAPAMRPADPSDAQRLR
ncbi:S8 family serine peptidase [Verrucosispora sp. TAA-831]|uniref:S8 family serine peptidase n=1 Tax=Verrucosispora sp. TAA-831 TaxID=3422227 RepID=UPI003D6F9513